MTLLRLAVHAWLRMQVDIQSSLLAGSVPTRGCVLLLICCSGTTLPVSASAFLLVFGSSTPLMLEAPSPSAVLTSEGPVFFNSPSLPNVPSIVTMRTLNGRMKYCLKTSCRPPTIASLEPEEDYSSVALISSSRLVRSTVVRRASTCITSNMSQAALAGH